MHLYKHTEKKSTHSSHKGTIQSCVLFLQLAKSSRSEGDIDFSTLDPGMSLLDFAPFSSVPSPVVKRGLIRLPELKSWLSLLTVCGLEQVTQLFCVSVY